MVPVPLGLSPAGLGASVDRLGANLALLGRFREIGSRNGGDLPPREEIESLQRLARRAGGVPALVAELMPSYSGVALDTEPGGGLRLGGRVVSGPPERSGPESAPAHSRGASAEVGVLRVALAVTAATGGTRRGTALAALAQLVDDVAAGARAPADGTAAARAWDEAAGRHGTVVAGPGGAVTWSGKARVPGEGAEGTSHLAAAVQMQLGRGVVHGRLGAAARTTVEETSISHWETARRLTPQARTFVAHLLEDLAAPGDGPREPLVRAAARARVDRRALADLHGPMVKALAGPLAALGSDGWERPPLVGSRDPELEGLPRVPDPLGVVYAVADLTAAAFVLDGGVP